MGFRKRLAAAIVGTVVAVLAFASAATASSHNPTGEFKQFGECPLNNPETSECVFGVTNGGSFDVGERTIPIKNPITLQGGYVEFQFHGAENGDTLSKTPQPVPGGLLGVTAPTSWPMFLQEWWNEMIEEGFTGVTATIELAEPATAITLSLENWLNQEGTAFGLPVKIKLDNALLGSNCYVGSNVNPVQVDLTTGTSGALTGNVGEISFNGSFTLITLSGFELVDGTYALPEADGCGGLFAEYIDPLVNSIFGLPAGSGENSFIFEGVFKFANDAPVRVP